MTTNMKFGHLGQKKVGQSGHDSNGAALDGLAEILANVAVGHEVDTNLSCVHILDTGKYQLISYILDNEHEIWTLWRT